MRTRTLACGVGLLGLSLLSLGGCSSSDDTAKPPSDPLASRLEKDTGVAWSVVRDERGRVLIASPIGAARPLTTKTEPSEIALDFFTRYASFFEATAADIPIVTNVTDERDGQKLVVLEQRVGQLPVWSSGASVHLAADGSLLWVEPTIGRGAERAPTSASINEDDAKARALGYVAEPNITIRATSAELGVLTDGADLKLVWQVDLAFEDPLVVRGAQTVYVDATTGALVSRSRGGLNHATWQGEAFSASHYFKDNPTQDKRSISAIEILPFNDWQLASPVVPGEAGGIKLSSMVALVGGVPIPEPVVGVPESAEWDRSPKGFDGVAVDAFANMTAAASWFESIFTKFKYQGGGRIEELPVIVRVPVGGIAAYNPLMHQVLVDNATNLEQGSNAPPSKPPAIAFDVMAHEYTHAVIYGHTQPLVRGKYPWTTRKIQNPRCEPLNEAMADIFAALAEHAKKPRMENIFFGEDVPPRNMMAIRYLDEPSRSFHPQLDRWYPGVESQVEPHTAAGIASKAFAMMTVGGTHYGVDIERGVGWDKSLELWWRTLTSLGKNPYGWLMQTVASRQINEAKRSKWNSSEVETLACAWLSVGVMTEPFVRTLLRLPDVPACLKQRVKPDKPDSNCAGQGDKVVCNRNVPNAASVCRNGKYHHTIQCSHFSLHCKHAPNNFTASFDDDGTLTCEPSP